MFRKLLVGRLLSGVFGFGLAGAVLAGPFEDALNGNLTGYSSSSSGTPPVPWTAFSGFAQSGAINDGAPPTFLDVPVTGPGTVAFEWRVQTFPSSPTLQPLSVNEVTTAGTLESIGPFTSSFSRLGLIMPAGARTLSWSYSQTQPTTPGFLDAGQLRNVSLFPVPRSEFTASDGTSGDRFGIDLAVSGNMAVVGATLASGGAADSGAAYVYDLLTGTERFKLTASDGVAFDGFGFSVSVFGRMAIVGAVSADTPTVTEAGVAYLFDTVTGVELHKLTASDAANGDSFGAAVAISGDRAVVGADLKDVGTAVNAGGAYVFDVESGEELHRLTAGNPEPQAQLGQAVAISGDIAVIGAPADNEAGIDAGAAYVFRVSTGEELFKLMASDAVGNSRFGHQVAVSGNLAVVSAPFGGTFRGAVYGFDVTTGQELFKLTAPDARDGDQFGEALALTPELLVIGAPARERAAANDAGLVYVFDPATDPVTHLISLLPAVPLPAVVQNFGEAVGTSGRNILLGKRPFADPEVAYFSQMPGMAAQTEVFPVEQIVPASGGQHAIQVIANGDWTASSDAEFAGVGTAAGAGNAEVGVTVSPNAGANSRVATITIGGVTHVVVQAGVGQSNPEAPIVAAPTIGTKKRVIVKGRSARIRATVASDLPGPALSARASGKARVSVRGGNPFRVIVKKIRRSKTRVILIATDPLGQSARTRVLVLMRRK